MSEKHDRGVRMFVFVDAGSVEDSAVVTNSDEADAVAEEARR